MKRIAIIGSAGAGKSTFARQLSTKLNIEVYHLDAILWKPNWTGTPKDERSIFKSHGKIILPLVLVKDGVWSLSGNRQNMKYKPQIK